MKLVSLILIIGVICTTAQDDFKKCKYRKEQYLPLDFNTGMDDLTYDASKEKIFLFSYSQCYTTFDDKFLIPDEVRIEKTKTKMDYASIRVDLIEHWKSYYPVTKKITAGNGWYPEMTRSFNSDFQEAKKIFLENYVIIRVQLTKAMYRLSWDFEKQSLMTNLQSMLINITNHVANGDDEHAAYFADLLVQKFGTTFPHAVTIGGLLSIEYVIPYKNIAGIDEISKGKLFDVVRIQFAKKFNLRYDEEKIRATVRDVEFYSKLLEEYKTLIFGGNDDGKNWEKSVADNPEIIDREVTSLKTLAYHDSIYTHCPTRIIHAVWKTLHEAILRYYDTNAYPGCTNHNSSNFMLGANIDDNTCDLEVKQYFNFGGLYQNCAETPTGNDFCAEFLQTNLLTGNYSCPVTYDDVLLRFNTIYKTVSTNQTLKCIWDQDERHCLPTVPVVNVTYSTYWCVQTAPMTFVDDTYDATFGGIYTSTTVNLVTGSKSCPSGFPAHKIDKDIYVCVGLKNQTVGVVFGGFFSRDGDNPLIFRPNVTNPFGFYYNCPKGYSRHRVRVVKNCVIWYCTGPSYNKNYEKAFPELTNPVTNVSLHLENVPKETLIVVEEVNRFLYYRNSTDSVWTFTSGTKDQVVKNITQTPALKELYDQWLAPKMVTLEPRPTDTYTTRSKFTSATTITSEIISKSCYLSVSTNLLIFVTVCVWRIR